MAALALDLFKMIGYSIENSIYEGQIKYYDKKNEKKEMKKVFAEVENLDKVISNPDQFKEVIDKKNDIVDIKDAPAVIGVKDEYENKVMTMAKKRAQGSWPIELTLTVAAKRANKWIDYSIYWMTVEQDIGYLAVDHETAQFINGITKMFGFSQKIYETEKTADLRNYDPAFPDKYVGDANAKFFISIQDLENRITAQFIDRMKKREQFLEYNKHINGISPLFTSIDNSGIGEDTHAPFDFITGEKKDDILKSKEVSNIDDVLRVNLDRALDPYIGKEHHYYEKYNDALTLLHIRRGSDPIDPYETYLIDHNGSLIGGGVPAVVAPTIFTNPGTNSYDTMIVPIADEFKDILTKVFESAFYQITNPEYNKIIGSVYYLNDQSIYHWLDMTGRNFTNLNADERMEFTNKLVFIGNILSQYFSYQCDDMPVMDIPRMRFQKYVDTHNWILVSDKYVSSPFDDGTTSQIVADDLTVICDNDKISLTDDQGKIYNFN